MSSTDKAEVVVSVDDAHLDHMEEVAEALRSAGMEVRERLDQIGAIAGFVDSANIDALKRVAGVSYIERSRTFQLPPPDSEIQ